MEGLRTGADGALADGRDRENVGMLLERSTGMYTLAAARLLYVALG